MTPIRHSRSSTIRSWSNKSYAATNTLTGADSASGPLQRAWHHAKPWKTWYSDVRRPCDCRRTCVEIPILQGLIHLGPGWIPRAGFCSIPLGAAPENRRPADTDRDQRRNGVVRVDTRICSERRFLFSKEQSQLGQSTV